VRWPCFYGIDFATRAELIATGLGVEEVRSSIGADSLGYISEEAMVASTGQPRERLCTACFSGVYPIELPARDRLGKSLFELPMEVNGEASGDAAAPLPEGAAGHRGRDADGVSTGVAGGAADALTRP
jgi:amidophosphoribosyltransferase